MDFKKIYKHDIFANEAGAILDELSDERAVMHLSVEPRHLNGGRVVHGGVVFLLADISMAAIANQHNPISVSIQSDVRFLAAAIEGDTLIAEAVMVFCRKRMSNCRVTITNQRGETIAIAEGMFHLANSVKVAE